MSIRVRREDPPEDLTFRREKFGRLQLPPRPSGLGSRSLEVAINDESNLLDIGALLKAIEDGWTDITVYTPHSFPRAFLPKNIAFEEVGKDLTTSYPQWVASSEAAKIINETLEEGLRVALIIPREAVKYLKPEIRDIEGIEYLEEIDDSVNLLVDSGIVLGFYGGPGSNPPTYRRLFRLISDSESRRSAPTEHRRSLLLEDALPEILTTDETSQGTLTPAILSQYVALRVYYFPQAGLPPLKHASLGLFEDFFAPLVYPEKIFIAEAWTVGLSYFGALFLKEWIEAMGEHRAFPGIVVAALMEANFPQKVPRKSSLHDWLELWNSHVDRALEGAFDLLPTDLLEERGILEREWVDFISLVKRLMVLTKSVVYGRFSAEEALRRGSPILGRVYRDWVVPSENRAVVERNAGFVGLSRFSDLYFLEIDFLEMTPQEKRLPQIQTLYVGEESLDEELPPLPSEEELQEAQMAWTFTSKPRDLFDSPKVF